MLFFVLFILATFQGLISARDICEDHVFNECFSKELRDSELPDTEAEFNRQCGLFQRYLSCLGDYAQKCGIENVEIIAFSEELLQRLVNTAQDVCSKDTELHKKIIENLVCLKNVLDSHHENCDTRSKMDKLGDHIRSIEEERGLDNESYSELWNSHHCLYEALDTSCFVSRTVEKCGVDAKAAVLEIINGMDVVRQYCPEEYREQTANLIEVFELEMEEENNLREMLSRE